MILHALNIPDDPTQLPRWLEQQLVGLHLAELAAELAAVHGSRASTSLEDVLGNFREVVLRNGLSDLPPTRLNQLLTQPRLLLELQELVLTEGGPHWEQLNAQAAEVNELAERGRARLGLLLTGKVSESRPLRTSWYRRLWVLSLAAAAAVLVAVLVSHHQLSSIPSSIPPVASTGWGWSKPDALPRNVTPREYLDALARAANEWFNRRPEDRAALARRIEELRQGCNVLIAAEHQPLAEADRKWLVERCQAWATKFDQALTDLKAGKDVTAVRDDVDATVRKLIDALQTRAVS